MRGVSGEGVRVGEGVGGGGGVGEIVRYGAEYNRPQITLRVGFKESLLEDIARNSSMGSLWLIPKNLNGMN